MYGERQDTMAVAAGTTGVMALVGGALLEGAMGLHAAGQQRRHDTAADAWARRAARAESLLVVARQEAAEADAQVVDLQDRLRHAEREIAALRRRLV